MSCDFFHKHFLDCDHFLSNDSFYEEVIWLINLLDICNKFSDSFDIKTIFIGKYIKDIAERLALYFLWLNLF